MNMIPYSHQWLDEEEIEAIVRTLKGNYLTQGPKIEEFEENLCNICGSKYAVAVSSGTAALHIAALAAKLGHADEGITSPNTFLASANCLIYSNAIPKFADIQADTYCLDPKELKERITPRTRAIIPVHFAGQPCDMESIWEMAKGKDLIVIEDAAHALGSKWQDKRGEWHQVGSCSHSHMTILSFHPVKTITTAEGGIILTNDPEIARTCRRLSNHGITKNSAEFLNLDFASLSRNQCSPCTGQNQSSPFTAQSSFPPWYYEMQELGFNYRITDIQCSLGLVQLKRLPLFIRRRREIWTRYQEQLACIEGLTLPVERKSACSCWHLYAAQAEARDELLMYLRTRGIGAHAMYIPVHLQPYYQRRFGYRRGDFPKAENYFEKSLILPLYPALTNEMQDYVIETVKSFYESN
ncbi:MAG: UDP-4-amino-4,6-dideoxy-N-acetyl-beta-L-altrosamine transaminase [bacterium]